MVLRHPRDQTSDPTGQAMNLRISTIVAVAALVVSGCASVAPSGKRELMVVANDEKQAWDKDGKVVLSALRAVGYRHWHRPAGAPNHR
jgi:hypothetical protein